MTENETKQNGTETEAFRERNGTEQKASEKRVLK
jgi:hypothetical protein